MSFRTSRLLQRQEDINNNNIGSTKVSISVDHTVLPFFTMTFHVILLLSERLKSWYNAGLPSYLSPLGYQHTITTPCELQKTKNLGCTKIHDFTFFSLHMLVSLETHASFSGNPCFILGKVMLHYLENTGLKQPHLIQFSTVNSREVIWGVRACMTLVCLGQFTKLLRSHK